MKALVAYFSASGVTAKVAKKLSDPKDEFRFECNECVYAKILGRRGLMKLGAMCCHADIINYRELGFRYFTALEKINV